MANQYTARVTAELVRGTLQSAIDKEAKSASVKISNFHVDAKSLASEIQKQLSNANIKLDLGGLQQQGHQAGEQISKGITTGLSGAGQAATKTFSQITSSAKASAEETKRVNDQLTRLRASTLSNNIQAWMNKNTSAAIKFEKELVGLQTDLAKLSDAKNLSPDSGSLKLLSAQFQNIKSQANAANMTVKGFHDSFVNLGSATKNFMLQMAGLGSAYQIGMKAINTVKEGVSTIIDLDTALVDLRKTTTMSDNQLAQFYRDANDEAKNLGVSTQEIIEQAAAWSRLGYSSAEEVKTMSRLSSQFAAISPGMSVTEAQDSLVSIMKAFSDQFPEVDDVLDGIMSKVNILGNSFALSNADLAAALKVSSSSMQAANNSFEETLALITAGTEITQDASKVGNGLRTISMRIRGLDEETGEFDETLGNVKNDISDLTHGKVSIMEDEN